jgi:diguanylate cyclase (GGDEF)-like protein
MTNHIILGIALFLVAIAFWQYLAIRRTLDTADHERLKQVHSAWRLLGIFLAFIILAQMLTLFNSIRPLIDIPDFLHYAIQLVGGLYLAIVMLLFRITLTNALQCLSPGKDLSALGDEAWRDPLTGLPNRRAIANTLKQEWHRSERHKRPLAVMMIDLDNFGRVIDECGHEGADEFLKAFAPFIAGQLRVVDIVARYDSDIFIIILPEEGPSTARLVAERIRKNIAEFRVDIKEHKISLTASIGVTNNAIGELESGDELLRRADHACTAARNGGHNRVVSYTATARMTG